MRGGWHCLTLGKGGRLLAQDTPAALRAGRWPGRALSK
jgi:hypothetical protein